MNFATILVTMLSVGNFRILKKLLPAVVGAEIWKSKKEAVSRTRTFAVAGKLTIGEGVFVLQNEHFSYFFRKNGEFFPFLLENDTEKYALVAF